MYVQEGLRLGYTYILSVCILLTLTAQCWQLIKFSCYHTHKSQVFTLDLAFKIDSSILKQISVFGSVQPIMIKPSVC